VSTPPARHPEPALRSAVAGGREHDRIRSDLAEIVEGAARLIERRWPFETAMSDHFARIWALREGRADLIWSIDSAHKPYLPAKA
jgi:hypothetical protein